MANTILHKRSSTPSAVPSGAQLAVGEIALNTADGKIFMKLDGGTVIDIVDHTSATSASEILSALLTVDGTGSGLDADLLDGQSSAYYLDFTNFTNIPDPTITLGGDATGSITLTDLAGGTLTVTVADNSHNHLAANVTDLTESVQDIVGGMVAGNTESGIAVTYDDPTGKLNFDVNDPLITIDGDVSGSATMTNLGNVTITTTVADNSHNHLAANISDLTESVQDIVGGMVSTNTESGITVTYDDPTGKLNFDVNDPLITLSGDVAGSATMTDLGNVTITTTVADDSHNHTTSTITGIQEYIEDVVGAMVTTGNTENGIAVTYNDTLGTLDFDVNDPLITLSGDVSGSATMTNLGNVTITTTVADDSHNHIISNVDGLQAALDAKLASSNYTAADVLAKLITVDGSGSGVDADTLDGVDSASFLRSDVSDTFSSGTLTIGAGAAIQWATAPTTANHLANKAYVDSAVSSGTLWRDALVDSDLVDVVGSNPATPEATYGVSTGADISFIATASFTFSYGTGSTVAATAGSIVNLRITSSGNGDYTLIEHPLAAGDRFIIAAEHGTIGSTLSGLVVGGFALADHDLIEFTGTGNGSSAASWSTPEGRSGLAGGGTEIIQGITVLVSDPDSTHYGHSYLYNAEDNAWVEIGGPGYIVAGNQLSFTGTTLNVLEGAGSGLDADLLDGQQGSYYLDWTNVTNKPDPVITLGGDLSGSVTLTDLGSGTLTATVADNSHNHLAANISDLTESVQDIVGGMVAGNTENGITVTYDDPTGKLNFDVNDPLITLSGDVSGSATMTNLGNVTITTTVADNSHNHLAANISDLTESVQDIVGAMVSANTESGISVVYQDADGTLDFDVNDPLITLSGDVSGSATMTNLGNVTITTTVADDSHNHIISNVDGLQAALDAKLATASLLSTLLTVDGAGSGLDADLLDGISSGSFLRSDAADSHSANITPSVNNTINLGSATFKYANVYATTFQGEATSAQYADLAEMYTADAEIAPGTVVCFGGEAEVTTCMHDMDRKVAGVVSTNPAHLMNADCDGVAVALAGRVPCRVSGSVKKGDMMVSDGKGGARAEENPVMGSVIGKALENSEGDNVIEIVVGRL